MSYIFRIFSVTSTYLHVWLNMRGLYVPKYIVLESKKYNSVVSNYYKYECIYVHCTYVLQYTGVEYVSE